MKLTLVQCASDRFVELQRAIAPHHQKYCERHGYNYLLHYGRFQTLYGPMWDKIPLIRIALNSSDIAVWMDSDSLIVNPSERLEDALAETNYIGQCIHPELWNGKPHFNCGVGFYRKNRTVREYLQAVWERGVVPHKSWSVQATMLAVNDEMDVMTKIDDKWNSTVETNESSNPVIESWHGHNQDFAPILKRLEEVALA